MSNELWLVCRYGHSDYKYLGVFPGVQCTLGSPSWLKICKKVIPILITWTAQAMCWYPSAIAGEGPSALIFELYGYGCRPNWDTVAKFMRKTSSTVSYLLKPLQLRSKRAQFWWEGVRIWNNIIEYKQYMQQKSIVWPKIKLGPYSQELSRARVRSEHGILQKMPAENLTRAHRIGHYSLSTPPGPIQMIKKSEFGINVPTHAQKHTHYIQHYACSTRTNYLKPGLRTGLHRAKLFECFRVDQEDFLPRRF